MTGEAVDGADAVDASSMALVRVSLFFLLVAPFLVAFRETPYTQGMFCRAHLAQSGRVWLHLTLAAVQASYSTR